ncbi:WAT1-related protein [Acorus calamus]|uniref:WAT1-related protein n=1 Tax=Acorus calamus TaxID=4465 RepID=A0AAV9CPK9_ACOCL|nr:WAT1-related protein [Acorus calamus]
MVSPAWIINCERRRRSEEMGRTKEVMDEIKPYVVITVVYLNFSVFTVLVKSVVSDGVSGTILTLYQFIVGTVVLFCLSFFIERMTLNQVLSSWSLGLVSATFYGVTTNMSPAIVFLLAVASGRERLRLLSGIGQLKVWGVITSVTGATVMVAWSGPTLRHNPSMASGGQFLGVVIGLQEPVAIKFPAELTLTAFMSLFGTIQTTAIAAITEPLDSWKIRIKGSLMLFVILYGGCVMPILAYYALIWCIHKKGPVFAAAFSPLLIVFSFFIETLILGKQAHLGSVVGAMLVIGGLYLLLLGMAKEQKRLQTLSPRFNIRNTPSNYIRRVEIKCEKFQENLKPSFD